MTTTRPSITLQAALVRCRVYVASYPTSDGRTLPVRFDELLAECRSTELYRHITADQLLHALRWGGWVEEDGYWAMPEQSTT